MGSVITLISPSNTTFSAVITPGDVGTSDYTAQVLNVGDETIWCGNDDDYSGTANTGHFVPVQPGQWSPVIYVTGTGNSGSGNFFLRVSENACNAYLLHTVL